MEDLIELENEIIENSEPMENRESNDNDMMNVNVDDTADNTNDNENDNEPAHNDIKADNVNKEKNNDNGDGGNENYSGIKRLIMR